MSEFPLIKDADPGLVKPWAYIGELQDVAHLFGDTYKKPGFTEVRQGKEEVSAGDILLSNDFHKCSARILINAGDGSMLLKHVGPKNFLEEGDGMYVQDPYRYFMSHAANNGSRVLAVNVSGSLSYHKLRNNTQDQPNKVDVIEMPEIKVDTGRKYNWAIVVDPSKSILIVKSTDEEGQPKFHGYQLPHFYNDNGQDAREEIRLKVDRKRQLDRSVARLGNMPLSSPNTQEFEEAKGVIFSNNSPINELEEWQILNAERDWGLSYARLMEMISIDPDRFEVGRTEIALQALDTLVNTRVLWHGPNGMRTQKALIAQSALFTAFRSLEQKHSNVMTCGGELLLNYYDSLIEAVGDPDLLIVENDQKAYPFLLQNRDLFAGMLRLPSQIPRRFI